MKSDLNGLLHGAKNLNMILNVMIVWETQTEAKHQTFVSTQQSGLNFVNATHLRLQNGEHNYHQMALTFSVLHAPFPFLEPVLSVVMHFPTILAVNHLHTTRSTRVALKHIPPTPKKIYTKKTQKYTWWSMCGYCGAPRTEFCDNRGHPSVDKRLPVQVGHLRGGGCCFHLLQPR